jgi:hypothetical protein
VVRAGALGLKSLAPIVAALPSLKKLWFDGNQLSPSEKKQVNALMRMPPAKRKLASAPPKRKLA